TRRARPDEEHLELGADLTQTGIFWRTSLPGGFTTTVAGRYGFPGLILSALKFPLGLNYWDYQARLDGPAPGGAFKLFAFGAQDDLTTEGTPYYATKFHRLLLNYTHSLGPLSGDYTVYVGTETTSAAKVLDNLRSRMLAPRLLWSLQLLDSLKLNFGAEGRARTYAADYVVSGVGSGNVIANAHINMGAAWVELPLWFGDVVSLTLAARGEVYTNKSSNRSTIDPRFGLRLRLAHSDLGDTWLKLGAGRFHQPPRPIIPIPGLEEFALSQGLESAYQTMVGAEVPLTRGLDLDVQGYFNYRDPIILDLAMNVDPTTIIGANARNSTPGILNNLLQPRVGRSYGLEIILRRRDVGDLFGWLSYTLSRSERHQATGWTPFDFDRTHMLQAVAGLTLPRNWQVGGRLSYQTGRPISTRDAYNGARSPGFTRLDLRIDKRAVWNDWLLDFYIDIVNTTLSEEFVDQTSVSPRYILP
ncbi:MAG TPA: hypothetical protein VFH51_10660, partial [Myxococcota bacterium]|nr:hypothetical protein [Myxococcota bacterium]